MKRTVSFLMLALISIAAAQRAHAATIVADVVIDYHKSPAGLALPQYGGTFSSGSYPVPVPLSFATDGNADTFVSLPTGSYLTLGFSSGFVFDGAGLDIFVSEVGGASETAKVFVSSDWGATFTFLGTATTSTVSGFDLASIGYTQNVNAVKVEGLDSFGTSPGFDLAYVQGLEGSVVQTVPDGGSTLLCLAGSVLFLFRFRATKR